MASSDDEDGILPSDVSNYYFQYDNETISFAELPLKWNDDESLEGNKKEIDLHGQTDNGLQTIFEQVIAWKFDISSREPEILVLTRKKNWIKLLKPRKFYEKTIRKILITVHCLSFVKGKPETSAKVLRDHLTKKFRSFDGSPSEDDVMTNLITETVKRDEILARAKVFNDFLEDKPRKKKIFEEVGTTAKSSFIVDDVPDENGEDGSDDEDEDFFEHVCAICDNGGDILCCDGKCLRSFHATVDAGAESNCESLGFSDKEVKAMANQTFLCKNCQYKQQLCFVCGELGSSDKSAGAEVFQCVTGTCGYFYHPRCVAKALKFKMGDKTKDLEREIAAGKTFVCPIHTCFACKEPEPEDKTDSQLQFAVCRRCPTAYHRKCLPRDIAFEDDEDQGIEQRAWEDLMPNKILIYCTKHEIKEELETPIRNHIKFPDIEGEKRKQDAESVGKAKLVQKKTALHKKREIASDAAASKNSIADKVKVFPKSSMAVKQLHSTKTNGGRLSIPESSKKRKLANVSMTESKRRPPRKDGRSIGGDSKAFLGEQLYEQYYNKDSGLATSVGGYTSDRKQQVKAARSVSKEADDSLMLDADSQERILSFVREAESKITLDDVIKEHKPPSTHGSSLKNIIQSITLGKVEGSIEALHAALQKLEEGGSLEDAKAVCEPGLLNQMVKWKSKLRVYLAPFLYGTRYTSFGRHFTKVEKLQAIVDKLHSYVADGDTVVDFCCGANDFSCLMKLKMDEMGKSCNFKNYDIKQAKNDFNFEKKDWMTVQKSDLPSGSKLIMGLNPPFGVKASLANKFIDKALQFKPKLLILIAPQETLRLDEKKNPYDLVWEDDKLLAGKAFYLPGSIDVNDKQMEDWNVNTPPLYLWSRPDWTVRHKKIARLQGHLPCAEKMMRLEDESSIPDCHMEPRDLHCNSTMLADSVGLQDVYQPAERGAKLVESHVEGFSNGRGDEQTPEDHSHKDQANGNWEDRNKTRITRGKGNEGRPKDHAHKHRAKGNYEGGNKHMRRHGGGSDIKSPDSKSLPRHSSPSSSCRSWGRSENTEMPLHLDAWREGYQQLEHQRVSGLQKQHYSYQDDGMVMHNSFSTEAAYLDMGSTWQHRVGPRSDYGFGAPDMQFLNYLSNHTSGLGGHGAQFSERNEAYGVQPDGRTQVQARFYGHEYPNSMSHGTHYMASPAPGFSSVYAQIGAYSGHNSTSTSSVHQYAPRLDGLNAPTVNSMGSAQHLDGRSGFYNTAPHPGRGSGELGFAPGPYRPYSKQNSSGWLNE
ncbi:protein ENHANCED DOWNY MILDEW 2 isoform X1 [Coffea arabica]|uniref:Protein ENHANCED DOWNY MILDEW 2 isoform X1 n=1 Tax=Coffea arabica TaxID=13443 RepID=A0A6P6XK77_COFAR